MESGKGGDGTHSAGIPQEAAAAAAASEQAWAVRWPTEGGRLCQPKKGASVPAGAE